MMDIPRFEAYPLMIGISFVNLRNFLG